MFLEGDVLVYILFVTLEARQHIDGEVMGSQRL